MSGFHLSPKGGGYPFAFYGKIVFKIIFNFFSHCPPVVCFGPGTLIRTVDGDTAVEDLQVGQKVVTASGGQRPIRWLGRRSIDCAEHPKPELVLPIRVRAGAFGGGRPSRDLILSPHHAVAVTCVDDVLIPVRLLVNGSTIAQIDAREITYHHVELDSHDILLANGLGAESFVDVGNRSDFEGEATVTLHPEFKSEALESYCRPLVTGGPILSAIRAQLAAVAKTPLPAATSFHLLVDGTAIDPVVKGHTAAFLVPAGARDVRLVSPKWSPRDVDPASGDPRSLGILVQTLSVDDLVGTVTEVGLDNPGLIAGFHPFERSPTGRCWRWTDGDALLSASLWQACTGPFVLRLTGRFAFGHDRRVADAA